MPNNFFEEKYKTLNKNQREAVDVIDGPVMVIAGPGTGKTTILTLRIANILKKTDTSPDSILALTFTDSGVRSMRKKLVEIMGPVAYRVGIYTFHGIADSIIKTYPDKFPKIIGSEHMEDLDQIRIIENILTEDSYELLRPKGNPSFYVQKIISIIQEIKKENIDYKKFVSLVKEQEKNILSLPDLKHEKGKYIGKIKGEYQDLLDKVAKNKELSRVYESYEKHLVKERLYDFDDMILEVVRALNVDEGLRLRLQEQYQYILADEHQDANNAQNLFLELLSSFHDNPNLFIVGDEKQAIFRFQGASLENFLYFKNKFSQAKVIALDENYRSHQKILDVGHSLIKNNPINDESLRVELLAKSNQIPEDIQIISFLDRDSEISGIADEIEKLIKNGVPKEEIAILIRDNRYAESIERTLSGRGIAVARYADSDALENSYIQAFLNLLRVVIDPSNDELVGKTLFSSFLNLDPIEISKAFSEWKKTEGIFFDFLKTKTYFKEVADKIYRFARLSRGEPLVEVFETIARDSGFLNFLISHKRAHELIPLYQGLLSTAIRHAERNKTASIADFMEKLDHAISHGKSISASYIPPQGVVLMTAHGSKGLEFTAVFIVHANDGVWGGRKSKRFFWLPGVDTDEDFYSDERRLFYVAITRAKKYLFITYHEKNSQNKDISPSRFIYELDEKCVKNKKGLIKLPVTSIISKENISLIKNKDYLRKLFLERGLSVTHINNFILCPTKYFFLNLLRLPRAQTNPELYGSAIHLALKNYFDAYAREEDISKETAIQIFEDYLRRTHMKKVDFIYHAKQGKRDLMKYLSNYQFSRSIWNEFKISGVPFNIGDTDIILNGNLDKVELVSQNIVNVVDYKTGKFKSRNAIEGKTKSADGNYKRQLTFYKLILNRYKVGEWKMDAGIIDFVSPDDKDKFHREVFSISDVEVLELEALIKKISQEILDFTFLNKDCDDPECEWCKLKNSIELYQ